MNGLLRKARRYLFGYDAVESKNRRQASTGRLRSEDKELLPHQGHNLKQEMVKRCCTAPECLTDATRRSNLPTVPQEVYIRR